MNDNEYQALIGLCLSIGLLIAGLIHIWGRL